MNSVNKLLNTATYSSPGSFSKLSPYFSLCGHKTKRKYIGSYLFQIWQKPIDSVEQTFSRPHIINQFRSEGKHASKSKVTLLESDSTERSSDCITDSGDVRSRQELFGVRLILTCIPKELK